MIIESKLTLGLIFAMATQAVAALVWAGGAAQRLEVVETQLRDSQPIVERLARVEAELAASRRQLDRIEGKLADD